MEVEIDHRLAELLLGIGVVDVVRLIDDIDEVTGFGLSPENLAKTNHQIPVVGKVLPICLAQVEMCSPAVDVIEARIGNQS